MGRSLDLHTCTMKVVAFCNVGAMLFLVDFLVDCSRGGNYGFS
jgi:hypothetical protein